MQRIALIGSAAGWGSPDSRSGAGAKVFADHVQKHPLPHSYWRAQVQVDDLFKGAMPKGRKATYPFVKTQCERLASEVQQALAAGEFPITVGGDHSMAMGTWSGVITERQAHQNFGLIWLDAHMDAHTPETAHEGKWGGNWHGMPLAHLMGQGDRALNQIGSAGAKINPQHLVLVGIRSFEPSEAKLLRRLGVRVIYMDEVKARGERAVMEEAYEIASAAKDGFGISIDLDGFNPEEAPAVSTREPEGLSAKRLLPIFKRLAADPQLRAVEIAEFNPSQDENNKTLQLLSQIVTSFAEGRNR